MAASYRSWHSASFLDLDTTTLVADLTLAADYFTSSS